MKNRHKLLAVILAVLLLPVFGGTALAAEATTGSITVTMRDTDSGAVVPGGKLLCREAARPAVQDGKSVWAYNEAFSGCGLSLEDPGSAALAEGLSDYAKKKNIPGRELAVGSDGRASFRNLTPGLYLITQVTPAQNYDPVRPFLVSIPMTTGGTRVYDVDASPKLELHKTQTPPPTATPTPTPTPTPSRTSQTYLPQTGQLWWPVPVMAVLGLLLLSLGLRKRADRR
jgi:hypothetical protein